MHEAVGELPQTSNEEQSHLKCCGYSPKVSVVMPVYNAEKYLNQAIESILRQTFTDFELIIIDDASNDNSLNIIKTYTDSRIVLLQNETNLKLIASLNSGINIAQGKYIARMDADDISLPQRLAVQVEFLDEHPNIAVCGTWMEMFGKGEPKILCLPKQSELIKCLLLFTNCIVHPSVMLRKNLGADFSYSDLYLHAEDYGLWVQLAKKYSINNIQQALLKYRISEDQIGARYKQKQWETVMRIQCEQINALGIQPTPEEAHLHLSISFGTILPSISLAQTALPLAKQTPEEYLTQLSYSGYTNASLAQATFNWLTKLKAANAKRQCYSEPVFTNVLQAYWTIVCKNLSHAF